jgi:general secretion pathway protein N
MIGKSRTTSKIILLMVLAILLALAAFMPLRFALGLALPQKSPVSAKAVSGSIWDGNIIDLKIGTLSFGNLNAGLRFFPLLLGQIKYRVEGMTVDGQPPLSGTITAGWGGRGIANMTGKLPLSGGDPRLPLSYLELQDISVNFDNTQCRKASGNMRLMLTKGSLSALGLDSGFFGTARCEGGMLLLPLVSQSAMERADIRLQAGGVYSITLTVLNENPEIGPLLASAGFVQISGGYRIVVKGQL